MDQQNAPCDYKRSGTGASGEGYLVGWRITSAKKNVANKLSGIHASPEPSKGKCISFTIKILIRFADSSFLVANFMGFSRTKSEDRFVLEAPEFTISDAPGAYLSFRKFLSTKGLYLSVCEDGYATRLVERSKIAYETRFAGSGASGMYMKTVLGRLQESGQRKWYCYRDN